MESIERPSKKQHELLTFVDGFIKGNGYGPSYREIMRALGYKSVSTVAVHVDSLINKGYLIKRTQSPRSLEVLKQQKTPLSVPDEHRAWLMKEIRERLNGDENARTEAETLLAAAMILGFGEDVRRLREKVAGSSYNKKDGTGEAGA